MGVRASFSKPQFLGMPLLLNANLAKEAMVFDTVSSYTENYQGGAVSVSDYSGTHELSLITGWRDIIPKRHPTIPTAFEASENVVSEAVPSVKTSAKYKFSKDSRDSAVSPTSGRLFQITSEIAGLFGDVRFLKSEA